MKNNKPFVDCECGLRVKGNSKAHAEANLEQHEKSKLHKKLMESKSG